MPTARDYSRPVIRAMDPHDDSLFRTWYAVMAAAASAGREAPPVVTYEALSTSLRNPGPLKKRTAYGAFVGDTLVGTALLELQIQDNTHLGEVDINVPVDQRRKGFGTSLFGHLHEVARQDGRTTFLTEVNVPAAHCVEEWPGSSFALRHGFISAHQEDHLILDLPLGPGRVKSLALAAEPHQRDYELVTWVGSCPDELVGAYASLNTAMGQDLPTGDLDFVPLMWDAVRVRNNDERMAAMGYTKITTMARHRGGEIAGYSLIFVNEDETTDVSQDDTLVLRAHRGHRLGVALKLANLAIVARDYPQRRTVHTWTAGVNAAMQRINEQFGFRKVEQMHEFQRIDQP